MCRSSAATVEAATIFAAAGMGIVLYYVKNITFMPLHNFPSLLGNLIVLVCIGGVTYLLGLALLGFFKREDLVFAKQFFSKV